jgi:hypothetical protein
MDVNDVIASSEPAPRAAAATVAPEPQPAAARAAFDREALEDQLFAGLDFATLRHRYLKSLLRQHDHNATRVAEISGLGRTTVFEWLRRWREPR